LAREPTPVYTNRLKCVECGRVSREDERGWTARVTVDDEVADWRSTLSDTSRYRLTAAMRQAFGAAVRWNYISVNPAVAAGRNPQPQSEELHPFTLAEIDRLDAELGDLYGPLVVFAAETGLRTNEWVPLERRDVDRVGQAVTVQRRFADRVLTGYPKTKRSRRRVPLTRRALDALERIPARLDTPLLFPAPKGGYIGLDTWRTREWYPALDAAGIGRRGPYHLRHTFATEALAAGVSIFQLARLMGTSVAMIDRTYGHLARDSEESIRAALDARSGVYLASAGERSGATELLSRLASGFVRVERAGIEPATSGLQSRRSPS
jgi:integrase